jgi:hypothetical protein
MNSGCNYLIWLRANSIGKNLMPHRDITITSSPSLWFGSQLDNLTISAHPEDTQYNL